MRMAPPVTSIGGMIFGMFAVRRVRARGAAPARGGFAPGLGLAPAG